jgi:hypothetical protein
MSISNTNSYGVYDRLGYSFPDPSANIAVQPYSDTVNNQMSMVPQFLEPWQMSDLANNNVSGYFTNPVATVSTNISVTSNNTNILLVGLTSSCTSPIVANAINNCFIVSANATSRIVANSVPDYIYHTNRMSNVTDIGEDAVNPHYNISIGYGKALSYLTYQTDGVQNNSPMLGSFTSVLIGNTLNQLYSDLSNSKTVLQNSISIGTVVIDGNTYTVNVSNISLVQAQALQNVTTTIRDTMDGFRQRDVNFYTNTKALMEEFNYVKQFTQTGQTEKELMLNYIGTDKLKLRLTTGNTA